RRIETLALMAGLELPARAIREQIASAIHVIVHQVRYPDGSRRIRTVAEATGLAEDGSIEVREILGFRRGGTGRSGEVCGEFFASGYLPSFLDDFVALGLVPDGEEYL